MVALVPLAEEIQVEVPDLLSPFNVDDAAFDGWEIRVVHMLWILLYRGPDQGYFAESSKSMLIADIPPKRTRCGGFLKRRS